MHPWVKGIQVIANEEPLNAHKVDNFFSYLNQHYDNHMCLLILTVSQVSDVAHEPLVRIY